MRSFETVLAILALGSSALLIAGCGGSDTGETMPGDGPTFARDIQPLVEAKCATCHVENGIAPFPLLTYDQVKAQKDAIAGAVSSRMMPPWMADDACTAYQGDFSLTDDQISLITKWVDAGAPEGDPGATPVPVTNNRLSLSRVDMELPIPVAYTPKTSPDDYRCFFLDWPAASTTYITGFGAAPDNASIVHHLIAYVVRPDKLQIFQDLDDADPDPGWACFGGPGGTGPSAAWLGGWAPGGTGQDFAEGTGIEVPAGSKIIVQIHYNTSTAKAAPDQSKILLKTDATVKKKAAVLPFADLQWLMGAMDIPAHSQDVVHQYDGDPTTLISAFTAGAFAGGKPLTIYGAGPHMHTRGKRIMTRLDHADGTSECMLDVPRWNFHWQMEYNFQEPKVISPGEKIHLECHWDNPGDTDLNWGESTTDEMCLGVYYMTE